VFQLAVTVLSVWFVFITTYRIRWIASALSLLVFDKNTAIIVLSYDPFQQTTPCNNT